MNSKMIKEKGWYDILKKGFAFINKAINWLKNKPKKYQFSLSVRSDRYQYITFICIWYITIYHISKVSLMPCNDFHWYQTYWTLGMLRSDEEINGLTNVWPGQGYVGPSLHFGGNGGYLLICWWWLLLFPDKLLEEWVPGSL